METVMKTHANAAFALALGISIGFGAALQPAGAQQASSYSNNVSSTSGTSGKDGTGESNPTGRVILCASRDCMDQQAAAANYPPTHRKPPRYPQKVVLKPREGCSVEWRWVTLSNGRVQPVHECVRRLRPVHYR